MAKYQKFQIYCPNNWQDISLFCINLFRRLSFSFEIQHWFCGSLLWVHSKNSKTVFFCTSVLFYTYFGCINTPKKELIKQKPWHWKLWVRSFGVEHWRCWWFSLSLAKSQRHTHIDTKRKCYRLKISTAVASNQFMFTSCHYHLSSSIIIVIVALLKISMAMIWMYENSTVSVPRKNYWK